MEETPKFFQMLIEIGKNKHFKIQRWLLRLIRFFQSISLLLIIGCLALCGMAYMGKTKEPTKLEQCYMIFCLAVAFIFFTLFVTHLLENCCIQKCVDEVKKVLKERISDLFPTFNYVLEMNSYQVVMIRPLSFEEGKPLILGGNDYFEYIKDHRPDGENFYLSSNPFELDPHEKNFSKILIEEKRMKDLEDQRQTRKDKMLRGFGGRNAGKNVRIKIGDGKDSEFKDEHVVTNKIE